ncbi:MAG TPA: endonuclease III domain-containing protein [Terriglobia bacterium]|nr:endonuclease III domain-containing protein [Terriglobia bacterium]
MGVPETASDRRRALLIHYYQTLLETLGSQGWWPARTRMEVILGAILTQNTTWRNAARALARLRKAGLFKLKKLRQLSPEELEIYVRPAGFFRQKAATISNFVKWLDQRHQGSLHSLFSTPSELLRQELMKLKGLGDETVDAILLYAGRKPFFVADAYTRRILSRHGWLPANADYATAQELIHRQLPRDPQLFNEFHALLVEIGKHYCKKQAPDCGKCPLAEYLPQRDLPHNGEKPLIASEQECQIEPSPA